ncbi:MAG: type IV secretion protein IcmB [Gammaproteobacteria bacterium RIFCSPHIGHO2_12_FULL_45_9]|nr:MAG: type IV secretion protein IcmB [Gammaproteobacteria bacterium RIFCSPHIGHO2_12_FULL_45_9]
MISSIKNFFKGFEGLAIGLSKTLKQNTADYCEVQTADSPTVLVTHDGSLLSIFKLDGIRILIGPQEFEQLCRSLQSTLQTTMSQAGHVLQVVFGHDGDSVSGDLEDILRPARDTASRVGLDLSDLFQERVANLSRYCAREEVYLAVWTRLKSLTADQLKRANREKIKTIRKKNIPGFRNTQNVIAAIPDLREGHDSFVRTIADELKTIGFSSQLLSSHEAVAAMRHMSDPEFTDRAWKPVLPGDTVRIKMNNSTRGDVSDILWPSLAKQILPRDGENRDLRTVRVGDRIYSSVFIDLFPRETQPFMRLFIRAMQTKMPWRISFLLESDGMAGTGVRKALSSVLAVTSSQNRLLNDALRVLDYIQLNTDDAVVKLKVNAVTWAPADDTRLLRTRASLLARAIEGWGSCDVSEYSGDAYQSYVASLVGVSGKSPAVATLAPLSQAIYMLPLFRPASPWTHGAVLFRTPDGKPWPYHPGSGAQTTWIDLFYARPGSGKSVLSNAINLAVCLSAGLTRLPRIAIIDIGPSSSGLISLLQDALPFEKRHWAAYHRLRMRPEYAINPFDTQLGCRYPTPQERAFLVNFLTLLVTPVGADKAYDGISDMSGLVIDELYKQKADDGNPNHYTAGLEETVDGILEEIGFVCDDATTWWEVTDALFMAGFVHEAMLAQRQAMPLLADAAAICREPAIEDLYGRISTPTGEPLIHGFARMISSAVREYPIISQITQFDLGDARIVALDLDEVARSGGDAANRQTAVMYMLARYVLARHYYLTEENVMDMPEAYRRYHQARILEIREDPKRIVLDEFHRTSKAQAVRQQVIQDMREGRKWKVQVALLSQSVEDFDEVMVEFATSIFIMDAGPEQAIRKTSAIFGLGATAELALKTRVHGPREGGATFLAQFSTKDGLNTQLLTATLGPIELWALSTTAEDVFVRNALYQRLGSRAARKLLATRFPSGSAVKAIEALYAEHKEHGATLDDDAKSGLLQTFVESLL